MHIMQIASGRGWNGAIGHCCLLSRELANRGNRVTVVCQPGSLLAEKLASLPVEVVLSDLHRWPTDELRRISAVIRDQAVNVVHTHLSRAHFFGVLLRWFCGVPTVATAHCRKIQAHWMLNDMVIAVSDATRRFHQRLNLVRRQRITTVHNFIEHHRILQLPPTTRAAVRGALGVDETTTWIGVVGTVEPRKSQIDLIRAMPKILAAEPSARLLIVGGYGPPRYVAKARRTAERLGIADRITWAGHRSDVHEILASLDIFVLPSREESLPLSILEAQVAGLPVVATAVGGTPECVQHRETGLLVSPADASALAAAVVSLIRDPALRRRLGRSGRDSVLEHFSLQGQTAAIEAVLSGVVQRREAA